MSVCGATSLSLLQPTRGLGSIDSGPQLPPAVSDSRAVCGRVENIVSGLQDREWEVSAFWLMCECGNVCAPGGIGGVAHSEVLVGSMEMCLHLVFWVSGFLFSFF